MVLRVFLVIVWKASSTIQFREEERLRISTVTSKSKAVRVFLQTRNTGNQEAGGFRVRKALLRPMLPTLREELPRQDEEQESQPPRKVFAVGCQYGRSEGRDCYYLLVFRG